MIASASPLLADGERCHKGVAVASIARLPSSTDDPRASGSTADRHESVERTGAPLEVMSTHRFQSIANCKGGKGPSTPLKRKKENGQPNISPRSHLRADDFFYSRLTLHATQHSVPEQLLSKGLFRHQARPPPALFSASPLPRSAHNRPGSTARARVGSASARSTRSASKICVLQMHPLLLAGLAWPR